jgi:hypothetical protein
MNETRKNRTSDEGRLVERIATVDPLELHEQIALSAIAALRHGAPVQLLDGLSFWSSNTGARSVIDERAAKRQRLRDEIARTEAEYRNARANANATDNERLRRDYIADSEVHARTLDGLEGQLAVLEQTPDTAPAASAFTSEADYLAHALAGLVLNGEYAPPDASDALSQIIEFTAFRAIAHTDPPQLETEFHLLLPANGMVAKFGPITCRVRNRAYRNTLRDNGDAAAARSLLAASYGDDAAGAGPRAIHAFAKALREAGWTRNAARLLSASGLTTLHQIAAHALWDRPLDVAIDPRLAELVIDTYSSPDFSWNPRAHALDCSLRQLCVDAVVANGGSMAYPDLEAALADTKVDDLRITIYSRGQQLGSAPTWHPCLIRVGDWLQQHPKSGRSLRAVACPHCGGWASKVIRTPETPACLLCPDCLKMPTHDSPTYPDVYLRL